MDLEAYEVDPQRGFLPPEDPLTKLPAGYEPWEETASQLPKLLVSDQTRRIIGSMPLIPTTPLKDKRELERAMMLLSYLGHSYVWTREEAPTKLPEPLAKPWAEIAERLGRPPVLSYASYALHNWRRISADRPIELGNIGLLQNFLGGADEEWFVLVHVDIEAKAAPAITSLPRGQQAVSANDPEALLAALKTIGAALERMYESLARMPEYCDPYIYYNRVRPYIHGWKENPAIPDGLIYEGVDKWADVPQQFRGETGAQSTIIPSLDAFLGIAQKDDPLKRHLNDMRNYMPPRHLAFLEAVERGPSVRDYVSALKDDRPSLRDAYNFCVTSIEKFRRKHLEYAARYIQQQQQSSEGNPTQIGTAGTPFMVYLKKHQAGTGDHLI